MKDAPTAVLTTVCSRVTALMGARCVTRTQDTARPNAGVDIPRASDGQDQDVESVRVCVTYSIMCMLVFISHEFLFNNVHVGISLS